MRLGVVGVLAGCSGFKPNDTADDHTVPESDTDTDADTDADADADSDADSDADTDTDTGGPWQSSIVVDGNVGDFVSGETFGTRGGTAHVTWDAANLYVGVAHPDVGNADGLHWVVLTLSNLSAGTSVGVGHGSQIPQLGFDATHVVRWKTDDSYDSLLAWDGATWVETAGWLGTDGSAQSFGAQQVEVGIPFARLGVGTEFLLHLNLVYEGPGFESSYAPIPQDSFVDGYDPDYSQWYRFDRDGTSAPNTYVAEQGVITAPTGTTGDTGVPAETGDTADTAAPPDPVWVLTPTVDGSLADWPPETEFTTSASTTTRIGYDAQNLYLAVQHPDVLTGGPENWLVAYVGNGAAGTQVGVVHNTQEPALAMTADHLIRWKADDSYSSLESWDGAAWVSTSPLFGAGGVRAESGDVVELSVPLATLGVTDLLDLYVGWLYEGAGFETTYAATPSGAIPDGAYDPDYAQHWRFDLTSALPPTAAVPVP